MNPFTAFVLGLLAGWLIEWVIDWIYWRRKGAKLQVESDASCRSRVAELEQEVLSYRAQLESLRAERARLDAASSPAPVRSASLDVQAEERGPASTLLDEMKGIGAALARRLKEAGIFTIGQLAALRPAQLREIAADDLDAPGSEVKIIEQARITAGMIKKADDLEIIKGIGPVIRGILNQGGIFSFAELAALTPDDLREIVGERIERLAKEEVILEQARKLAEEQD